jgi:outer membrane protein
MRILKASLPALLLFLPAAVDAQAAGPIAFVNSQVILDQDPGAQAALEQFEADLARYQAEIEQLGNEGQALIDQYEQQQAMLSEEARANREEEIRLKQTEYQQRVSELDQQAGRRRAELLQPVMERISGIIEAIRAEGGYAMIFDLAVQGVLAADTTLDLTQTVIQRLQAEPGG